MEDRIYISKITHNRTILEKLYDKMIPMCRKAGRSSHRALGIGSTIKRLDKEIMIVKCSSKRTVRAYKRQKNRRVDVEKINIDTLDVAQ